MDQTIVWLIFVIATVLYFTVAFTATWLLYKDLSSHFMALLFLAIVAIYACFFACVIVIRIFAKPRENENDSLENCEQEMHLRQDMGDRFHSHQPTGNDLYIQILPLQVATTVCPQLPIDVPRPVHQSRSYPVILSQFNHPGAIFESPTKRCVRPQSVNSEIQNITRHNLGRQALRRSVSSPNPLQRGQPFQLHDFKSYLNNPASDTTDDLKSGRVCGLAKVFHKEALLSARRKVHRISKKSCASSATVEQAKLDHLNGSSPLRSQLSNDQHVPCFSISESGAVSSVSEAPPLNVCHLSPSEYQKRRIKRTYSNYINHRSNVAQVQPGQHSFGFP